MGCSDLDSNRQPSVRWWGWPGQPLRGFWATLFPSPCPSAAGFSLSGVQGNISRPLARGANPGTMHPIIRAPCPGAGRGAHRRERQPGKEGVNSNLTGSGHRAVLSSVLWQPQTRLLEVPDPDWTLRKGRAQGGGSASLVTRTLPAQAWLSGARRGLLNLPREGHVPVQDGPTGPVGSALSLNT